MASCTELCDSGENCRNRAVSQYEIRPGSLERVSDVRNGSRCNPFPVTARCVPRSYHLPVFLHEVTHAALSDSALCRSIVIIGGNFCGDLEAEHRRIVQFLSAQ